MESTFIITTDSTSDLGVDRAKAFGIPYLPLFFTIHNEERYDDMSEATAKLLYSGMREANPVSTSQSTVEQFIEFWTPFLEQGLDILHFALSGALSGTINSANIAARSLREQYPGRRIVPIDSLAASGGEGLFVRHVVEFQQEGNDLDACIKYADEIRLHVQHWFTVDDLMHLKRGGRVSSVSAFLGSLLSIKPVLNVDCEGRLIPREKAKGRKASIKHLFEHMCETISPDPKLNRYVHICHGDCIDEALHLKDMILNRFDFIEEVSVEYIGAVIGSHAGPGTIALFFMGDERID